MESRRRRRISGFVIALFLVVPTLVIVAGIALTMMEMARNPWMYWGRIGWWVLSLFSTPVLLLGVYLAYRSHKYRKSMKDFWVDEKAILRFDEEYRHGDRVRIGKIVLTDNWLFSSDASMTCLLPLGEAVWIYGTSQEQAAGRGGGTIVVHSVKVHFRNGVMLAVACTKYNIGQAMRAFAQRCPKAKFGYYDGREREWKEEAKRWRASR